MNEPGTLLPPFPVVPSAALDAWREAHDGLAVAAASADPGVSAAVRHWQVHHQVAGLAGIQPTIVGVPDLALFPAQRGFLSGHERRRTAGVAAAFEHVDLRIVLAQRGVDRFAIHSETPFVLHALVEGPTTSDEETNPGIFRSAVSSWTMRNSPYQHPPVDILPATVDALVRTGATALVAPPVVAGWLAFCWMSLHPWVDGNGRTARLLYLLAASRDLPQLDLGVMEQFAHRRGDYTRALQAGQWPAKAWDPALVDPAPFTQAAIDWSIDGTVLSRQRLAVAGAAHDALDGQVRGWASESARTRGLAITLRAWLQRLLLPSSLAVRGGDGGEPAGPPYELLEELVDIGLLERVPVPPGHREPGRTGIGYRVPRYPADVMRAAAVAAAGDAAAVPGALPALPPVRGG